MTKFQKLKFEKLKLKCALEKQEGRPVPVTLPSPAALHALTPCVPDSQSRGMPQCIDEELEWPSKWSRLASHEWHNKVKPAAICT